MIIRPSWLHARSPSIKPLINDNQSLLLRSVINLKSIYWLFIIVIWFEILPEWSTPSDVPHVLNFTSTHRCYPWHAWAAWGKDGEEETHALHGVSVHPGWNGVSPSGLGQNTWREKSLLPWRMMKSWLSNTLNTKGMSAGDSYSDKFCFFPLRPG